MRIFWAAIEISFERTVKKSTSYFWHAFESWRGKLIRWISTLPFLNFIPKNFLAKRYHTIGIREPGSHNSAKSAIFLRIVCPILTKTNIRDRMTLSDFLFLLRNLQVEHSTIFSSRFFSNFKCWKPTLQVSFSRRFSTSQLSPWKNFPKQTMIRETTAHDNQRLTRTSAKLRG